MVLKGNRTDTSIVLTKRLTSPNQRQWKLGKSFEAQTKSPQLWNLKQLWTPLRVNMSKTYIKHDHQSKEPLLHSWSWLPQFFSIKYTIHLLHAAFIDLLLSTTNLLTSWEVYPIHFLLYRITQTKKKRTLSSSTYLPSSIFMYVYINIYNILQPNMKYSQIYKKN